MFGSYSQDQYHYQKQIHRLLQSRLSISVFPCRKGYQSTDRGYTRSGISKMLLDLDFRISMLQQLNCDTRDQMLNIDRTILLIHICFQPRVQNNFNLLLERCQSQY
eukprot:NODE_84_length_22354_cov_0.646506.p22 type:complete len:106 gc:universal NODE_84_length_22354_cov_0.646506:18472-18155(-)